MAQKLRDEDLHLNIIINGNKAKKELGDLEKANKDLRNVNKELLSEKAKLEASGKKETAEYKRITAAISENNATIKTNETRMSALRKEIGLAGLTYRQLSVEAKRLKREMDNATPGTAEWKKLKSELEAVQKQMGVARGQANSMKTAYSNMVGQIRGLLPAMGIAAIVAGLRKVSQITIEFSAAQSNLAAVLGKTKSEIRALTDDAVRYGSITKYTAKQVSDLQTEFAKLGFTESQIRSSTKATLDFAAATNGELGPAAKVVGVSLKAFNLSAAQTERVASAMAVATTKSALSFEDLETILSTVGPIANAYGLTLEDTLALTGKLKDAGFDASSAATATRNILLNLADANGNLAQALGRPVKSLDELVPALVDLKNRGIDVNETLQLTDKRSVAAFNAFLVAAGSTLELRDGLIGVNEQLQSMVDTQLDNLAGDMTILTSAWQGFVLSIERGDGIIAKFARVTVQFLTDALIKLSNLDLIFKRASKFTEDEVARVYDAMMSLSGNKYKAFQSIIEKENQLTLDQVILRRDAMIKEIRDTGQSQKEAVKLWDEYYNRRKEQSINALTAKSEEERAAQEREENERLVRERNAQKLSEEQRKKGLTDSLKALEDAHQMRLLKIEQQGIAENRSLEMINLDKLIAEKAYVAQKMAILEAAGESTIELQRKIAQDEINLMAQAKLEAKRIEDEIKKQRDQDFTLFEKWLNDRNAGEQDALTKSIDQNIAYGKLVKQEGESLVKSEKMQLAERADAIMSFTERIGDNFQEFFIKQDISFAEFLQNTLVQTLDFIEQMMIAAIAQTTIKSIMEGAPLNPLAVAKAAAKILLLKAAFGVAKSAIIGKGNKSEGNNYYTGGYTPSGTWNEPKGVVHSDEFVANRFAVRNPSVRQFLDVFDMAQRNGSIRYLNTQAIISQLPLRQMYSGGYSSTRSTESTGGQNNTIIPTGLTDEQIDRFDKAIEKLIRYRPAIAIEQIKKELEEWDNMERNRGL